MARIYDLAMEIDASKTDLLCGVKEKLLLNSRDSNRCQVRFADIQQEDGSIGRLASQLKRCNDFQFVSYFHEFYMNDFPVMPVDRGR